jgi:excisionase family DNA binding protein
MPSLDDYITVPDAAKERGVTEQAILDLIYRGKLAAQKVGRQWLIKKRDLAAYTPDPGGRPPKKKRPPRSPKTPERRRSKND